MVRETISRGGGAELSEWSVGNHEIKKMVRDLSKFGSLCSKEYTASLVCLESSAPVRTRLRVRFPPRRTFPKQIKFVLGMAGFFLSYPLSSLSER